MEATLDRPSSNRILPLIGISIVAASILALLIVTNAHAFERHGASVYTASSCFDNNPSFRMYNPTTQRNADVCFDGSKFHIHITTKNGDAVTTFTKDKMSKVDQVVRYLTNAGYLPAGPIH
jgi:hypothetical protein